MPRLSAPLSRCCRNLNYEPRLPSVGAIQQSGLAQSSWDVRSPNCPDPNASENQLLAA